MKKNTHKSFLVEPYKNNRFEWFLEAVIFQHFCLEQPYNKAAITASTGDCVGRGMFNAFGTHCELKTPAQLTSRQRTHTVNVFKTCTNSVKSGKKLHSQYYHSQSSS